MVKLNKIYTRTGDDGSTGLGDGTRVAKGSNRVSAYGDVDEANACIGMALVCLKEDSRFEDAVRALMKVQNDLFDLGADLCMPETEDETSGVALRIKERDVAALENHIDIFNADLEPLTSFVLPGGSETAARLHIARTVVRRAERQITSLAETETVNASALRYVNRLSDLLFVLARYVNAKGDGDGLWRPGGER